MAVHKPIGDVTLTMCRFFVHSIVRGICVVYESEIGLNLKDVSASIHKFLDWSKCTYQPMAQL